MELAFNRVDFFAFLILLILFFYVLLANEIRNLHKVYILFHAAMMTWPYGQFQLSTSSDLTFQWIHLNLSFIGISFLGYGWLVFSMMLTSGGRVRSRKTYWLLGFFALLSAVLVTSNPIHGWFAAPVNGQFVERVYGPAFWWVAGSCVVYVLLGFLVMFHALRSATVPAFRRQVSLILAGQTMLLTAAVLDTLLYNIPGLPRIEGLTSIGIVLSDLCFVVAIRKNNVFRVISIALREVVDSMDTGIVILDEHLTVIDKNKIASRFCKPKIGQPFPIEKLMEGTLEPGFGREFLQSYFRERGKFLQTEVLVQDRVPIHVSVRITPIYTNNGMFAGRIVTLQDVTEWRHMMYELNHRNEHLELQNTELTRMQEELSIANRKLEHLATVDSLTGCFNRRYMFQMLEYQLAVEQRYHVPFSILLLDLDHFKQINDTYGHHVGDEVLRHTAAVIRSRLRETDIFARYGGEEFTIFLPYTEKPEALDLAEELRRIVESQVVRTDRGDIRTTVSIGLVCISGNTQARENPKEFLVEVLRQADGALYEAKGKGRNRIVSA